MANIKKDGELNEKYPGGIEAHKQHLEAEGHEIIQKGERFFVKDYLKNMFDLDLLNIDFDPISRN